MAPFTAGDLCEVAGGFPHVSDAARVKGARVVHESVDIALSRNGNGYAILRETVQRNLYRTPLR